MSDEYFSRFAVIRKHIGKYKYALALGGLSITLSGAMYVIRPYIVKLLLDDMEAGTLQNYGLGLAGALIGLTAIGGVFSFINRRTVIWTSRKLEYDIRGELFRKLLRLPLSFYHQRRVGDIMARLTNDVEAVRMMFGPAIMYFANTVVSTALAVGIMLYMAPKLTLYILIPMPIISFL
ncbi:MAG: ABC transporter transmembrane domain-containing protein, partial [Candidatus Zixiibacteriota bacterium]